MEDYRITALDALILLCIKNAGCGIIKGDEEMTSEEIAWLRKIYYFDRPDAENYDDSTTEIKAGLLRKLINEVEELNIYKKNLNIYKKNFETMQKLAPTYFNYLTKKEVNE
jgi:hypothetical protein